MIDSGPHVMAQPSTLIIPVENQIRELDAKILLSCVAAERGFPVVLGSRGYIHQQITSLPRGVYLAKSMRSLSERMFSILRGLGHEIVGWDEEGVVRGPDPYYHERRLSPKALRMVSLLFAWGEDDARAVRACPGFPGIPIHITGNPRVDLLRSDVRAYFDPEVAALRERFGPFILVNTNFALVNHFVPKLGNGRPAPGEPPTGVQAEVLTRLRVLRSGLFRAFQQMIPAIAEALPDYAIVIRPHPVERAEPWEAAARDHKRVHVLQEGSVVPWLIAARVLVHNCCTTSVEASILGTPSVAYEPVRGDFPESTLPNSLSHRAADLEQLIRTLRAIMDGRLGALPEGERRHLRYHIASLEGPLASDRMVDVLEQAGYLGQCPAKPGALRYLRGWAGATLRSHQKRISSRRRNHRTSAEYHDHRFPDISTEMIRERIERFGNLLGRFRGLCVRQSSRHIFHIDRSAPGDRSAD